MKNEIVLTINVCNSAGEPVQLQATLKYLKGHPKSILHYDNCLIAGFCLDKLHDGIKWFSIDIPLKDYTREEFIQVTGLAAVKFLDHYLARQRVYLVMTRKELAERAAGVRRAIGIE